MIIKKRVLAIPFIIPLLTERHFLFPGNRPIKPDLQRFSSARNSQEQVFILTSVITLIATGIS